MGTNYYLVTDENTEHDYENHIGKRSAAGRYCWKCDVTLCKEGKDFVHKSSDKSWLDFCPNCGDKYDVNHGGNAAFKELGFFDGDLETETIGSCASFSWAKYPFKVYDELRKNKKLRIQDEYGRFFTTQDFKEMIQKNCPIQYFENVGESFS